MKRKNPKLLFIQSVAQQARRLESEISAESKSVIKNLQQRPKTHYTIKDVEDVVETLKNKMLILNKEAHTEFSKQGIKSLDGEDLTSIDIDSSLVSSDELEELKIENENLRKQLSDLKPLEMKIEDLQILLEEKDAELTQLRGDSGLSEEKVQNQIEELNKLQELLDETQREAKQAKKDREKIEAEFETVGNALMTTRLEIEELQTALANKDIEIENMNSEIQILSNHTEENIRLKEENSKLLFEMKELGTKNEELILQINEMDESILTLREQIKKLEEENEDLLLDSGETSQEAVSLQNELAEIKEALVNQKNENKEIMHRMSSEITSLKQDLTERSARTENLQNKLLETQELLEENKKTRRTLESQLEDFRIELKGNENRILSLESDRNELQEKHTNMKIEYETQKTEIIDLRTKVETKDRELERWQKDLEILRERQETIAKDAFQSRDAVAEFERERDVYETKLKDLNREVELAKDKEIRYEKKINDKQEELEKSRAEIESLIDNQKRLVKKTENLSTAVETLRINLAKNPKYAILFVLQDIQEASVGELAKTVAIQLVFAARLMKELQQEGWIDFNEDTGLVRLKRPLLEID